MMKRTRLFLLLGLLALPAVAWAGHTALEAAGCCPLCDHGCDGNCPLKHAK